MRRKILSVLLILFLVIAASAIGACGANLQKHNTVHADSGDTAVISMDSAFDSTNTYLDLTIHIDSPVNIGGCTLYVYYGNGGQSNFTGGVEMKDPVADGTVTIKDCPTDMKGVESVDTVLVYFIDTNRVVDNPEFDLVTLRFTMTPAAQAKISQDFSVNRVREIVDRAGNAMVSECLPMGTVVRDSSGIHYTVEFGITGDGGADVTAKVNGSYGISSNDTVSQGSTITFTANPEPGYRVKQWTVNGAQKGNTNPLTVTNIAADQTVTVEFEAIPPAHYDLTSTILWIILILAIIVIIISFTASLWMKVLDRKSV